MNPSPEWSASERRAAEAQSGPTPPSGRKSKNAWPAGCAGTFQGTLCVVSRRQAIRRSRLVQNSQIPIGIAIEKGFHSLVEVLLRNGVSADERALAKAVRRRNKDIVELLLQFGAKVGMVGLEPIVYIPNESGVCFRWHRFL